MAEKSVRAVGGAPAIVPAEQPPPQSVAAEIERLVIDGDLSKLSPAQRVSYYQHLCHSLGLNPLTRPFAYLTLNGKLQLYAQKSCTDQLRRLRGVSIGQLRHEYDADVGMYTVFAPATDKDGRTDEDIGVVPTLNVGGEALANAKMKCVTKAKRRVTLSICGLAILDESEVESIPDARPVPREIAESAAPDPPEHPRSDPSPPPTPSRDGDPLITAGQVKLLFAQAKNVGVAGTELETYIDEHFGVPITKLPRGLVDSVLKWIHSRAD